ncbi:MAG: oligopeptide/dipeptide ABC transporter ATP-binding protein [Celeribacter sp.]
MPDTDGSLAGAAAPEKLTDGLHVENVSVTYMTGRSFLSSGTPVRAVRNASFTVPKGHTLGIVGESGCGKSSLARALVGLAPVNEGRVSWDGQTISGLGEKAFRPLRKDIQMVFQDPFSSLNPKLKVFDVLAEPLRTHMPNLSKAEMTQRVGEVLETVGLQKEVMTRYSHELSGGQAQRIGIGRAVITRPGLLLCDESVSALDVSVQATILNLLKKLQADLDLSMIFISHDLGVIKYIADSVAVLYLGQIVESGSVEEVLDAPSHPYTQLLLQSSLSADGRRITAAIDGAEPVELPSNTAPPTGCAFRARCPRAQEKCKSPPELRPMSGTAHRAACHFPIVSEEAT